MKIVKHVNLLNCWWSKGSAMACSICHSLIPWYCWYYCEISSPILYKVNHSYRLNWLDMVAKNEKHYSLLSRILCQFILQKFGNPPV